MMIVLEYKKKNGEKTKISKHENDDFQHFEISTSVLSDTESQSLGRFKMSPYLLCNIIYNL